MFSPPKHDHEKLKALFAAAPLAELSSGLYYAYGFILSMVSAPEIIQPSEWLPLIFKSGEPPECKTQQEVEEIIGGVMSIWSFWANQIHDSEQIGLPPGCNLVDDDQPSPDLRQFCSGYLMGSEWLRELWDEGLEPFGEDSEQESSLAMAMILCLLIHKREVIMEDASEDAQPLRDLSTAEALSMLPGTLMAVATLGRAIHLKAMRNATPVQVDPKPGRNDPCPCGSGKKYKKCCM